MLTKLSITKMFYFNLGGTFTDAEIEEIKSRIKAFELNKSVGGKSLRNGGSELRSEVAKLEIHLQQVQNITERIKAVLSPSERSRTTLAAQEVVHIKNAAGMLLSLPETILRQVGESALGDAQLDFTVQELPYALAIKQVRGAEYTLAISDVEDFLVQLAKSA